MFENFESPESIQKFEIFGISKILLEKIDFSVENIHFDFFGNQIFQNHFSPKWFSSCLSCSGGLKYEPWTLQKCTF